MRLVAMMVVGALVVTVRHAAEACSYPPCTTGYLEPSSSRSDVPANIPALYWRPMTAYDFTAAPDSVTLANTASPDVALALHATPLANGDYLLVPDQPLIAATSYQLTDHSVCGRATSEFKGPELVFSVGPAVPLPTQLGTLRADPQTVSEISVGAASDCSAEVDAAQVGVHLEIAAEAAPWRSILQFETLVDGRPWKPQQFSFARPAPGASWRGRGDDMVYQICRKLDGNGVNIIEGGVAAGRHVVELRASLPGTATTLSATTTIELACVGNIPGVPGVPGAGGGPGDGGGGCAATGSHGWLVAMLAALVANAARKRR